jgi:hypothetical protein
MSGLEGTLCYVALTLDCFTYNAMTAHIYSQQRSFRYREIGGGVGKGGRERGWDGSRVICLHLITHDHIKQDPYHTEHVRVVNLQ